MNTTHETLRVSRPSCESGDLKRRAFIIQMDAGCVQDVVEAQHHGFVRAENALFGLVVVQRWFGHTAVGDNLVVRPAQGSPDLRAPALVSAASFPVKVPHRKIHLEHHQSGRARLA